MVTLPQPAPTRLVRRLVAQTRAEARREVLGWFLDELPGSEASTTRYQYVVEEVGQEGEVMLVRPAMLNKGSDFAVVAPSWLTYKNGNPKPPSHQDVLVLARTIGNAEAERPDLLPAIRCVHACGSIVDAVRQLPDELRTDRAALLLSVLKWLFIEQDITYWNYSGRDRLLAFLEDELRR